MPGLKKYLHICLEIKKRIAGKFYTERLPSRRQLMQEFEVSSRTIHKVLEELKLQGIVETTPSGTLLRRQPAAAPAEREQILLFSPEEADFTEKCLASWRIMQLAAADLVEIKKYVKDSNIKVETLFEQIPIERCDGIIFINSSYNSADGDFLKARHIPFVSGNRPGIGENINWVDWNHLELFDDMLGEIVSRGVRSVDFFMPELPSGRMPDNFSQIMADFRAAKKSYMLYNPELDDREIEEPCSVEKYAEFIANLKHLPDAMLLFYSHYTMLIDELRKYDLDLTSRMVCIGGSCELDENTQILYTHRARRQLGEKIWKLLQYVRHHTDAPPRGVKQRCELKFSAEFKKLKFKH